MGEKPDSSSWCASGFLVRQKEHLSGGTMPFSQVRLGELKQVTGSMRCGHMGTAGLRALSETHGARPAHQPQTPQSTHFLSLELHTGP